MPSVFEVIAPIPELGALTTSIRPLSSHLILNSESGVIALVQEFSMKEGLPFISDARFTIPCFGACGHHGTALPPGSVPAPLHLVRSDAPTAVPTPAVDPVVPLKRRARR